MSTALRAAIEAVPANWTPRSEGGRPLSRQAACRVSDLDLRAPPPCGPACGGRAAKAEPTADAGPAAPRGAALLGDTARFGRMTGLFVPKPTTGADCQRPSTRGLRQTVRGRPLASTGLRRVPDLPSFMQYAVTGRYCAGCRHGHATLIM